MKVINKPVLPKRYVAWAMGVGLALFAVHNANQPLLEYAFLPVVGLAIVVVCVITILDKWRPESLGPKWVWIPMLVIVGLLWLRLIVNFSLDTVAGGVTGLLFFGIYLASRSLGKQILEVFLPLVIIEALSIITMGIMFPGVKNGGIISHSGNYDIATGFLIMGLVFSAIRYQWWLSALVVVALFFTGADEAIFACVVLGVVILARKDWSKKVLLPVGALLLVVAICTPLGITRQLYFPGIEKIAYAKELAEKQPVIVEVAEKIPEPVKDALLGKIRTVETIVNTKGVTDEVEIAQKITNNRWSTFVWGIKRTKLLGHGLNLTDFSKERMVHNVPLIISNQIGPIGAVAWLVIIGWCLVRTRWKYAFIAILALSVFDHFIWTQVGFWWWALVGVATISTLDTDLIFKEV